MNFKNIISKAILFPFTALIPSVKKEEPKKPNPEVQTKAEAKRQRKNAKRARDFHSHTV